jgi:hypothetical protein
MWDGERVELSVYRLTDGRRIAHRDLGEDEPADGQSLTFLHDEVQVRTTTDGHTRLSVRVVQLRQL